MNKGEREGILDVIGYIISHYQESDEKVIAIAEVLEDLKKIEKAVQK